MDNKKEKVYVLLADGFETIEALTPVDVCTRCKIDVTTVSIANTEFVTSSHGVTVKADILWKDADFEDGTVLILPGGYPGYVNLANSQEVGNLLTKYYAEGRIVGAICGAPSVLAANKVAVGKRITCHHSVIDKMEGYCYTDEIVTCDGNLVTAKGAGRSVEFCIAIMKKLCDNATIDHLLQGLEVTE
jgi:4-methyl-5(b-hydroxyethyl)-thiazole monophosphate biosynthesis